MSTPLNHHSTDLITTPSRAIQSEELEKEARKRRLEEDRRRAEEERQQQQQQGAAREQQPELVPSAGLAMVAGVGGGGSLEGHSRGGTC